MIDITTTGTISERAMLEEELAQNAHGKSIISVSIQLSNKIQFADYFEVVISTKLALLHPLLY
jgi:hypothetical protein